MLIDSLRASGKLSRLRDLLPGDEDHDDEHHQLSLELEDESNEKDARWAPRILHPDEAAAAVLLGKAFERSRDVLAVLRQPDTLAIITVSHADFVEPVTNVLRKHVLGAETSVIGGDSMGKRPNLVSPDAVVIFESSAEAAPRKTRLGGAEFAAAVQLRCAIIGVTSDLGLLPHELVSLAEHRIVVPPLDGPAVGDVIEAVTGRRPSTQIDEKLVSRVS